MELHTFLYTILLQISLVILSTDAFYVGTNNPDRNAGVSSSGIRRAQHVLNPFADVTTPNSELDATSPGVSSETDNPSDDASSSTTEDEEEYDYDEDNSIADTRKEISSHKNWPLLDNKGKCGRTKVHVEDKTLGGENADMAEYPWMARLIYRSKDDSEMGACGGSIINSRYVVTAAHCCPDEESDPLAIVRLGEYDVHHTMDCFRGECAPPPVEVGVQDITKHHNYDEGSLNNDICLIRLSEEVKFTDYIQPICLPTSEELTRSFVGTTLTLTGWGEIQTVPEGRLPDKLQEVRLRVVSGLRCMGWDAESYNSDTMICAGGFVGRDACAGDSGGPLMYTDTEDVDDHGSARNYLVGIVSSGMPCSNESGDSVSGEYTKVSKFMEWILDTIHS